MNNNNMQLTTFCIGMALACVSAFSFAAESHMAEDLKHAEAAAKAPDSKTAAEHATTAKAHAATASEHLTAGTKSLNDLVEHDKQGHADLAKKSAEEAVEHLKAAQ
jgi:hypothetical protein